jgi:hypothetical protein
MVRNRLSWWDNHPSHLVSVITLVLVLTLFAGSFVSKSPGQVQAHVVAKPKPKPEPQPSTLPYVVLGYNELGMHCMNQDFSEICILPPFNTLRAQVILRNHDSPQVVTSSLDVQFSIR